MRARSSREQALLAGVFLGLVFLASTFVLAPSLTAAFPWFSAAYTRAEGDCGSDVGIDPVNIVFQGSNAWANDVARNVNVHGNMPDSSGSTQSLLVTSSTGPQCRSMDFQRATGADDRTHIRLWRAPTTSGASKLVPASAHYERRTGRYEPGCFGTHAVSPVDYTLPYDLNPSGFDVGRRYVVGRFQDAGHAAEGKLWGNKQAMKQCDGGWAASDGVGVVIQNDHRH